MVRAFQKGDQTQTPSSEVARVASSIKMKDAKKFASTKHKGLPEKKVKKESVEHVGNSDFRSSAEFMNTFAKLKRLRKKNDKIGTGNTGLPQGVAQTNRRGKMQGVEEAAIGTAAGGGAVTGSTSYTGPNKADRKVIKKMDNKKFASKLADYEKNMDPKKREALKDKATKGMKFTHEGTSYGLYKGDGKPKMQFAGFVKKAKPDTKKKPVARKTGNPAFDDPSHHSNRKSLSRSEDTEVYWSSKALDSLDELNKKTLGSYVKKASTDMAIGAVKGDKDKVKKRHSGILTATDKITKEEVEELEETPKGDKGKSTATKQDDRSVRSYGTGYGRKYNAPARKVIHQMKRGVKKYKGEKENNDGSTKMTNYIDDRKSHFHRQGKSYAEPSRKKVKEEVAISEKIKYDKKGSSMDYFLGKDPKKTEYYKKNAKKKNESKSSCECKHESFAKFLEEGNATGRMLQKSKTQVTGHISADRGSDEKKNQSKRKGLEKDLKKHKIGHKKGVGEYKYDSGETGREVSYQTSKPDKMSKRRFGKVMRRLGRKHGQESVITKDKDKPAKLHTTEKGSKEKSQTLGKSKAGKHPKGYGETSGTKVRSAKLPKKTNKSSYHYG